MKIAITGITGFIGSQLARRLVAEGHEVTGLTRDVERARARFSFPVSLRDRPVEALRGADAVVTLAGESVGGRWTASRKRAIYESRVLGTRRLVEAWTSLPSVERPRVWVSASAVGVYGDRGDEWVSERSSPGRGFLAQVCQDWEKESIGSAALAMSGVRSVAIRVGVVISEGGGVLERLLPLFKMGLGGPVGSGNQWMSWVHVDDVISVFVAALRDERFKGVVNAVAPSPVTQREFARALGAALARPAVLPVPAAALRLVLGEMSELVLSSQRVKGEALEKLGFRFAAETIDAAFRRCSLR